MEDKQKNTNVDQKLKGFIDRIENLEEEKKKISEDISQNYKEAKNFGYNVKVIRKLISLRKLDIDERVELDTLLDTYAEAIQMDLFK